MSSLTSRICSSYLQFVRRSEFSLSLTIKYHESIICIPLTGVLVLKMSELVLGFVDPVVGLLKFVLVLEVFGFLCLETSGQLSVKRGNGLVEKFGLGLHRVELVHKLVTLLLDFLE